MNTRFTYLRLTLQRMGKVTVSSNAQILTQRIKKNEERQKYVSNERENKVRASKKKKAIMKQIYVIYSINSSK